MLRMLARYAYMLRMLARYAYMLRMLARYAYMLRMLACAGAAAARRCADRQGPPPYCQRHQHAGTHFTCFPSTKVEILYAALIDRGLLPTVSVTSTQVLLLTLLAFLVLK